MNLPFFAVEACVPGGVQNQAEKFFEKCLLGSTGTKIDFSGLGTFSFEIIFVIITKLIPPEDFLCNVAATGVSLFARKQAKEFVL